MSPLRATRARAALVAGPIAAAAASGCVDPLDVGEVGDARYFGTVRGTVPLALRPPTSDREGNVYVLFGAEDQAEAQVFIGRRTGGWSSECKLTEGDGSGVHGFVGHDEGRAFYWSGDALVAVTGATGDCRALLDVDPVTGANLAFRGVIPHVRDTPSARSLVALVQTVTDPAPFAVVVDLDLGTYLDAHALGPSGASKFEVLASGYDDAADEGVVLLRYERGGQVAVEARYYDADAIETRVVKLGSKGELATATGVGRLRTDGSDVLAGLLRVGDDVELLTIAGERGRLAKVGFEAAGLHRFDDRLWVVGVDDGRPVVAAIDAEGNLGGREVWEASLRAREALRGIREVVDDRTTTTRDLAWPKTESAVGPFPFVHADEPDAWAAGTTTWLVAGPAYEFSGGEQRTSVALVPIGIAYP